MAHRVGRLAVGLLVGYAVFIGWSEAESPRPGSAPKADGPVQGSPGGYDPTDQSKTPAAPDGQQADTGNAAVVEGR